jgi:hypothetical protein
MNLRRTAIFLVIVMFAVAATLMPELVYWPSSPPLMTF